MLTTPEYDYVERQSILYIIKMFSTRARCLLSKFTTVNVLRTRQAKPDYTQTFDDSLFTCHGSPTYRIAWKRCNPDLKKIIRTLSRVRSLF